MNIAVDATSFGHDEVKRKSLVNSTSIFTADLLDGFAALGKESLFTLIVNEGHEAFFRERFPQYKLLALKWLPLSLLRRLSGEKFAGTKYIKKLGIYKKKVEKAGFDLLWFPFTVSYSVAETAIPSVFTIHDMFRFHTLNETAHFDFIRNEKNSIAAISACTKNDIKKSLDYEKEIPVIPNSVQLDISQTEKVGCLDGKQFVLDINAYIEKKNPMTLLRAFSLIADKTSCHLVFCGGYRDETVFSQMNRFIAAEQLEDRVHCLFRIPLEKRNWLLKHAALFVTPSLYEGFGRTPVEAMLCRVPVISTKETSLLEATMGLCSYVENPKDEKELAEVMLKNLLQPAGTDELRAIAETVKSEYSAEKCAKKYLELFMNALGGNSSHILTRGGGKGSSS